jgi:chromate reductase, NAD(P)H dehydrogenase (quinone)
MPKILAVAGSFRQNSYNRRVLAIAAEGARNAGAEVTTLDLRDFPLPAFDADDVEQNGFNKNALRLQDAFNEHDGFLICSPEYNASIPGGFKNAIDWASRANEKYKTYEPFKGKTAAIMTASPGQFGGVRCMAHLRAVFTIMGVHLLPSEVSITFVGEKFDGDGMEMTDEKTKAFLEKIGATLASTLK